MLVEIKIAVILSMLSVPAMTEGMDSPKQQEHSFPFGMFII